MSLTIKGHIHTILEPVQVKDDFKKQDFILEIDGQYTQLAQFQMINERCDILATLQPMQRVEVHFDLRGNMWNGKCITNLQCWKIVDLSKAAN